jgi:hypothetical protein
MGARAGGRGGGRGVRLRDRYRTLARRSMEASPDLRDTSPVLEGPTAIAVSWFQHD